MSLVKSRDNSFRGQMETKENPGRFLINMCRVTITILRMLVGKVCMMMPMLMNLMAHTLTYKLTTCTASHRQNPVVKIRFVMET